MKILKFVYRTSQTFSSDITDHYFTLRCLPREEARQKTLALRYRFWPQAGIVTSKDVFDNFVQKGEILYPHHDFGFETEGIVRVDHSKKRTGWHPCYKYASACTTPGAFLRQYRERCLQKGEPEGDELARALYWMNCLYRDFGYQTGITDVHTTAEQAMEMGKGVCQDYAHILIALCHMDGIGARYVVGFMIGEGATHAWVEIMCGGYWYGLDPTNNLMVDETYIKLSHGRDYNDCTVVRGSFYGQASQHQEVYVSVEELQAKDQERIL